MKPFDPLRIQLAIRLFIFRLENADSLLENAVLARICLDDKGNYFLALKLLFRTKLILAQKLFLALTLFNTKNTCFSTKDF